MLEGLVISTCNYGLDAFCGRVKLVKLEVSLILYLNFSPQNVLHFRPFYYQVGYERFVEQIIGGKFKITNCATAAEN